MIEPASDPDVERAERMGAVAFLRLRKDDLVAAALVQHIETGGTGQILGFPARRLAPLRPTMTGYEDPRIADWHKSD